ncbi:MAG: hypothetical protein GXP17_10810 [Gammaproteobacteria bacterium]|nr:hypothetical protein [Gammaproteobacteria bacterium]
MPYPKHFVGQTMGCQKKVWKIIQQEGDYVLSLKSNLGCLHNDVSTYFTSILPPEPAGHSGEVDTDSGAK